MSSGVELHGDDLNPSCASVVVVRSRDTGGSQSEWECQTGQISLLGLHIRQHHWGKGWNKDKLQITGKLCQGYKHITEMRVGSLDNLSSHLSSFCLFVFGFNFSFILKRKKILSVILSSRPKLICVWNKRGPVFAL